MDLNLNLDKKGVTQEEVDIYRTIGGAPHLDGAYTVFGEVLEGMDVVDAISKIEVDELNKPIDKFILSMSAEELPRVEITNLYGVDYTEKEE